MSIPTANYYLLSPPPCKEKYAREPFYIDFIIDLE